MFSPARAGSPGVPWSFDLLDGFDTVARFAGDHDIGMHGQHAAEALAPGFFVIDNQASHRFLGIRMVARVPPAGRGAKVREARSW